MDSWITPTDLFFVRHHHPVPAVDPKEFRLHVNAPGVPPTSFSLHDLQTKFKHHTVRSPSLLFLLFSLSSDDTTASHRALAAAPTLLLKATNAQWSIATARTPTHGGGAHPS